MCLATLIWTDPSRFVVNALIPKGNVSRRERCVTLSYQLCFQNLKVFKIEDSYLRARALLPFRIIQGTLGQCTTGLSEGCFSLDWEEVPL